MVYVTGDTHRDFSRLRLLDLTEDDLIIVLGDVGINYYLNDSDSRVKKKLSKMPCKFFFIRGNHEERPENIPGYKLIDVDGIVKGRVYLQKKYPKLMFAADGPCEIDGNKCFVVNGAYSVDKYYRQEKHLAWFPDEELTDDEMERILTLAEQTKTVDYIFSHTCPQKYVPVDTFMLTVDQSTVSRRMEEFLDKIDGVLDYKRWWCGHYHIDYTIDNLRFMFYDILELRRIRENEESKIHI